MPERFKITGTHDGVAPLWKIRDEAGRVVAYCTRQSDAERIVAALERATELAASLIERPGECPT